MNVFNDEPLSNDDDKWGTNKLSFFPVIRCVGQAASMGSLLLSSGAPGMRHALPNARIMIHQVSGGAQVHSIWMDESKSDYWFRKIERNFLGSSDWYWNSSGRNQQTEKEADKHLCEAHQTTVRSTVHQNGTGPFFERWRSEGIGHCGQRAGASTVGGAGKERKLNLTERDWDFFSILWIIG